MSVIVPAGWVVKQDGGYCPWRKWPRTQDIFALLFGTPAPPASCSSCPNFDAAQRRGHFLKSRKHTYFWYLLGFCEASKGDAVKRKQVSEVQLIKTENRQKRKSLYNCSMDNRGEFPPPVQTIFTHVCMWVCIEITGRPIPSFLCCPALQPACAYSNDPYVSRNYGKHICTTRPSLQ